MRVGDRIPAFAAPDQDGSEVSSDELLADGPLVAYFYVKAKTPG